MRLVLLVLLTFPALAEPVRDVAKRAWEWTDEERIARRVDPVDRMERQRFYPPATVRLDKEVIRGSDHPELFLPFELFDTLLRNRPFPERVRAAGFDDATFWVELEALTADYRALEEKNLALQKQTPPGSMRSPEFLRQMRELWAGRCRARVDALESARAQFGRERFDRFLYEVVAPATSHSGDVISADLLQQLAKGCK